MQKKQKIDPKASEVLMKCAKAEMVYAILCRSTNLPYVECDDDTFDDEVFIFFEESNAKKKMEELKRSGDNVDIMNINNSNRLGFFAHLSALGVNAVVVGAGTEGEIRVQVDQIISKGEVTDANRIQLTENPTFHLTAIYLIQAIRRPGGVKNQEEVDELQEEMYAQFPEGKYLVVENEKKQVSLLTYKDGNSFQPIFTDMFEVRKYLAGKKEKFQIRVLEVDAIAKGAPKEAKGVVVNPMGINIQLRMTVSQK